MPFLLCFLGLRPLFPAAFCLLVCLCFFAMILGLCFWLFFPRVVLGFFGQRLFVVVDVSFARCFSPGVSSPVFRSRG